LTFRFSDDKEDKKMEKIKDLKLNKEIFGIEPNNSVMMDAIITAKNGLRQGTYSTKTRSEVSGGGRKPWRQKGTGRARQGSIRATQWRGGGIALGPKPRDYSIKMNRKERRLALVSALSSKNQEKAIIVVDNIDLATSKTKDMINVLKTLEILDKKVLIIMDELTEEVILASRNLSNVLLMEPNEINVLDIVNADILLFNKQGLSDVEEALK
jgi:large subunit ribosomal protein L4